MSTSCSLASALILYHKLLCEADPRHSLLANLGTRVRPSQVGHALAGPGTRGGCPPPGIPGRAKDRREAREREGALFSSHP